MILGRSPLEDHLARVVIRLARQATFIILFTIAAILGSISGVLFVFAGDLPEVSALDDYAPSTITRVYAADGAVIAEFAVQRRVLVTYDQISPYFRNALIAAEDENFNSHMGLSITRIIVTAASDLLHRRKYGASTLTQQLANNLFSLTHVKSGWQGWERKIKEALLAIQIEKRYTKNEILTLYSNHVLFGHGTFGVEAASRLYFNKSAKDLKLEEAALLAGIIQSPSRESPYVDPAAAMRRRNYTLGRMAEAGFITQAQADAAKASPIVTTGRPSLESAAPYFAEEIRKYLEDTYGAKQLYESGLSVQTSLDLKLQGVAERALDDGVRRLDKRHGFRRPRNVLTEQHTLAGFTTDEWKKLPEVGQVVPALVMGSSASGAEVRVGHLRGLIGRESVAWTNKPASTLMKAGDLVELRVTAIDEKQGTIAGSLEQEPLVEGAVLAIQNRTGQILAMVGGHNFEVSKFNRSVQALRQLGSAFKPIVYTTAIDRGYTPTSVLMDAPVSYNAGPGQPLYSPHNYDRKFEGAVTLRHALEESRNVPTVRLMEQLGPASVIDYAKRLGFSSPVQPYLSSALGSSEATLLEVVSAYSTFPNQGVRMQPYGLIKVTDRQGNLLEEHRPEPTDAIRADTAFVMTNLLRGVVQRGTAAKAAALNWPLGGKTGTTEDFGDAWFVGFDPEITVGVWVGYDRKKSLGSGMTGAAAALPIWMDIMKAYIGDRQQKPEFPSPGNIIFLSVDKSTGVQVDPSTPGSIQEAFISGTQPGSTFK
jgi:penicillin-binding protein 1A